ncbi:DUF1289 domain-containing protein [Pelomonas sp. PFR6]|uniref:DUF1289 domain-containing protein n=2 Tax=Roseateles violae TaxID=3058042 RepID=A0ABT8DUP3_9BURK|nr:DUF1289 domain-containing protein [Pelomonas sp. PFR6]MDN3922000.1 DUF1289 domain-containing protein [Pelomonas sp. PFR6]
MKNCPPPPVPLPAVHSPCINVCRMHAGTGWCEGCARTIAEIAAWGGADDATRLQILARLPERRRLLVEQGVFSAAEADMP